MFEFAIFVLCAVILGVFFFGERIVALWKKIKGCSHGGRHEWRYQDKNNFGGRIYSCTKCGEREVSGGVPLHYLS